MDWAFVNNEWLINMPAYATTFPPESISNHSPIKVDMMNTLPKVKKPFQFCNFWSNHPQFDDKVKEVWQVQVDGCKKLQVIKKFKLLKRKLKELNGQIFQKHSNRGR